MLNIFKKKNIITKNPIRTVSLSFITIIVIGTVFLYLPISSNTGKNISLLDALFTSTSATCVTGLAIKDTFTQWSTFGKIIILILIQTGGLGLITFSSIFLLILNNKLSLKNMKLASSQINVKNFADIKSVFKNLLLITFFCEFLGTIILSISFCKKVGPYGIFMAIFSSVGAYCNAGLDLNGIISENISFIPFSKDYLVIITMGLLTFLGGIGFVVLNEILNLKKNKIKLKCMSINSKIAIYGSIFLIIIGGLGFLILEYNFTLKDMNFIDKIANSLFNSTTSRTSGFSTIDFSKTTSFTKFFTSILMFIGASPTGTAGGIKITTIIILISTTFCVIKNSEENIIFGHKIDKSLTYKAVALISLYMTILFISIISIWSVDAKIGLSNIIFTATSAFSTTGFSSVPSSCFSSLSKFILILLMYIGRIGPISFALFFNFNSKRQNQLFLPNADLYL